MQKENLTSFLTPGSPNTEGVRDQQLPGGGDVGESHVQGASTEGQKMCRVG